MLRLPLLSRSTCVRSRLFITAALCALLAAAPAQAAISALERQTLIDLYNSTNGAGWTNRSHWRNAADTDFNTPGTECTWHGVACDAGENHVTRIDLRSNHLTGTLPATLNQLSHLTNFAVFNNRLTGPIPSLAGLSNLSTFVVSSNQLTGTIPSLSDLSSLYQFNVADNRLTGSIPNLTGLTSLRMLSLSYNQLTGTIPSLDGLPNLRYIRLIDNQLTGTPPAAPATLSAGDSALCPNLLHTPSPTDADWHTATGRIWSDGCTPGYLVSAVAAGAGGSVSPPTRGVSAGSTADFTLTPDAGHVVDAVSSTCGGTLSGSTYTTGTVSADCTVTASFRATGTVTPVPTLSHWALMLLGLGAAGLAARRLRQRQ